MTSLRRHFLAGSVLLCGWAGDALVAAGATPGVSKYDGRMNLSGQFPDPGLFVENRIQEGLWLAALLLVWAGGHYLLASRVGPRLLSRWRWVAHAFLGFALLNLWVACAASTAIFWMMLGAGTGEEPYAQFQFKRCLAGEVQSSRRIVLVGPSQTHSQIDVRLLNERLDTNGWSTDLHFPGCKAQDLLLIEPQLARARPTLVVYYLSEAGLYLNFDTGLASQFLSWDQLPDVWRTGALKHIPRREAAYGLLGGVLPLFRCRDAMGHRLLGSEFMDLKRGQSDAGRMADLEGRAERRARRFLINSESEFQQWALDEFVARCESAGHRVLILTGATNPVLTQKVPAAVHEDFQRYLARLATRHPQMILVPASALPEQTSADYFPLDLVHVHSDMQRRFTLRLAELLKDLLRKPEVR